MVVVGGKYFGSFFEIVSLLGSFFGSGVLLVVSFLSNSLVFLLRVLTLWTLLVDIVEFLRQLVSFDEFLKEVRGCKVSDFLQSFEAEEFFSFLLFKFDTFNSFNFSTGSFELYLFLADF